MSLLQRLISQIPSLIMSHISYLTFYFLNPKEVQSSISKISKLSFLKNSVIYIDILRFVLQKITYENEKSETVNQLSRSLNGVQ